jgi:hypothetical protein
MLLQIRRVVVPIQFIRKSPNNGKYWPMAKLPREVIFWFRQSLARLKSGDDSVGIAFDAQPLGDKADDNLWPSNTVIRDLGFANSGDLVLDYHLPSLHDTAKDLIRQKMV